MPHDHLFARRGAAPATADLDPTGGAMAPGKATRVEAMRMPFAPVQRKADPVQRQGGDEPAPPSVVNQYGAGTHAGRDNDCGPACIWMVLRMLGADHEARLEQWIVAHRPDAATYRDRYGYATNTDPVGAQERLDVARWCGSSAFRVLGARGTLPDARVPDGTMTVTAVRAAITGMLRLLGADASSEAIAAMVAQMPLSAETAGDLRNLQPANVEANRAAVLAFLRDHAAGDRAVIALGQPQIRTDRGVADTAWGWGGDNPIPRDGTVRNAVGGHFVIVSGWNGRLFTVLDPSYSFRRSATEDQMIAFLGALGTAAVVNLLPVPIAELRALVPDAAPAQAQDGGTGTTGDPGAPPSGGTPLPSPTLERMERAFGADFSGVRVHVDPRAAAIGALAYAQGEHLIFAPGQFRPGTPAGDALIGHELAHVLQQRAGRVATDGHGQIVDDPALEAEADREGERAAHHDVALDEAGGAGAGPTPAPAPAIPDGPIPRELLVAAARDPDQAIAVAAWCTLHLLDPEQLRAFWAATPADVRGAILGQLAVRLAKLEMMLGWIGAGGMSITTDVGFENATGTNLSQADGSSNRGTFPGRYQGIYAGGAGMSGYDWCGMFVGYLYGELLHLDDPSMGPDGIEGWRGGDTVMASGNPKIWPERVTSGPTLGTLRGFRGGVPRAGDVAVTTRDPYVGADPDAREPHHVALVEEVTDARVRTIDGNVALVPGTLAGSSAGSHDPNAIAGRGYDRTADDGPTGEENYFYHQTRIVCFVRITDRAGNFAAPAPGTPAVTGEALAERLDRANAQVQAVLNALPGTTTPYDPRGTVYGWVRGEPGSTGQPAP